MHGNHLRCGHGHSIVILLAVLPVGAASADDQLGRIRAIIAARGDDPAAPAQLIQLTRDIPAESAAALFDQIAVDNFQAGRIAAAAQYRQLLVEKFPDEPVADKGVLWLMRYLCSSELAYVERSQAVADQSGAQGPVGRVRPDILYAALHFASDAASRRPALADSPALTFQRAVADRLRGQPKPAAGWLTILKRRPADDLWRKRALAETWLVERDVSQRSKTDPPLGLAHCIAARRPPRLDGRLDELIWEATPPTAIDEGASPTTEVRLAYDAEHLYLGVHAQRMANFVYAADDRPRPQDGAAGTHDRVRIHLDLDRDYATCYEFTVDSRGWTHDAAWGLARWNPQWFVAAGDGTGAWRIEAAIAWAELTSQPPEPGEAWTVAFERLAPGKKSYDDRPRDFRLLLFE